MVTTLPRSSPGSGPVIVETERGGLVESSLTFSYVPAEAAGTPAPGLGAGSGGGGVVMGGVGRISSMSGTFIATMTESPLLSSRKPKQSGKSEYRLSLYNSVINTWSY